jgi:hypothetical protein
MLSKPLSTTLLRQSPGLILEAGIRPVTPSVTKAIVAVPVPIRGGALTLGGLRLTKVNCPSHYFIELSVGQHPHLISPHPFTSNKPRTTFVWPARGLPESQLNSGELSKSNMLTSAEVPTPVRIVAGNS